MNQKPNQFASTRQPISPRDICDCCHSVPCVCTAQALRECTAFEAQNNGQGNRPKTMPNKGNG